MMKDGRVAFTLSLSKKTKARWFGKGRGHGLHGGDHQSLIANSLKATSLTLPGMISLSDPT